MRAILFFSTTTCYQGICVLPFWIRSTACLLSLCCYSQLVEGFTVSSTADTANPGTLRWAIGQLNAAGGGTVAFDPSIAGGTLTLLSNLPALNATGGTTVIGAPLGPLLHVNGSNVATALTVQGGTLSLNNMPISGAVAINASAAVTIGSSASLPFGNTLANQGLLAFDFSSGTVSAPISGNGAVDIVSGSLSFNGSNTYAGTTTIASGATLTVLSISAFPSSSPIVDNGALIITLPSANAQLPTSEPISGSGVVNINQGVVTFSGLNSYGGTTTIGSSGILQIGASGALPVNGSVINSGSLSFQNGQGVALPGVISGPGGVVMNGFQGAVQLTGTNTYLGGTQLKAGTIQIATPAALGSGIIGFDGGTLELLSSFTGTFAATATFSANGGTLAFDGVTAAYAGLIQGGGPFNCSGTGTLSLTGSNTYGGQLTIGPRVVVEVNADAALGSDAVVDNGDLIFNLPSKTVAVPLTGLGKVTFNGSGGFSLTQVAKAYQGGTIISQGTLLVNDPRTIGTGPITMEAGGTLEPLVSLSAMGIIGVGGGSIKPGQGATLTVSGLLTSPSNAPFAIVGEGSVVLSGDSTSTALVTLGSGVASDGHLIIQNSTFAGPVLVNAGAVLQGSGSTQDLTNNGSVVLSPLTAPGVPTLNVTGDYAQGSDAVLQVAIDGPGQATLLHVSQTAHLDGTLVVTAASQGAYAFGETYQIITSGNDLSTVFSTVLLPPIPRLAVIYNADPSVALVVTSQSVLQGAQVTGHNPQQVLANLQQIVHTPRSDLITVLTAMESLDASQLSVALDQLHPAQFGAFDLLNVNTGEMITSLFTERLSEACCIHLGSDCGCKGKEVWVAPFGYFYDQEKIGEQLGFRADAVGLVAGLNFCAREGYLLGLGAAYSSSELHWQESRGQGSMDKVSLCMYTNYAAHGWSIDGALVGGLDVFNATRNIAFSTINRAAKHERGGYDLTAHIGVSGDVKLGRFYLSPFGRADYFNLYQKGFTESGADSLNLTVEGRHTQMLRSELGLKFTSSWKMGHGGCFAPTVHCSGINECSLVKRHYKANFIGETPRYLVRTFSNPIYLISPGLDLNFTWGYGLELSLGYSAELNSQITTQKLTGRLGWFF